MKILVLSFYYAPDLCAGSFRTTALVEKLRKNKDVEVEVITTLPNRYASFSAEAPAKEQTENSIIHRVALPPHKSGMFDQAKAFLTYYLQAMDIVELQSYDAVYATSSRLFTALLGARVAIKKELPLYLDIRDIFVDTINDLLSAKITWAVKPVFSFIERYAFNRANRINLVSKGFNSYFEGRYVSKEFRWFTNGIDDEFLVADTKFENSISESINVLYAGNIGEGQGLHTIIPNLSKRLKVKVTITVIGDGGRKEQLIKSLDGAENVIVLPPVNRQTLIEEYRKADVLFLHLNDYPAFKKVLPSKIFEYAALGKPIWAGVAGYPSEFLNNEVENCAIFKPGDEEDAIRAFSALKITDIDRKEFKEKYARGGIMEKMAKDILEFAING